VDWWTAVVAVLVGLALLWVVLIVLLVAGSRDTGRIGSAARLLPDLVRLLSGLARDRAVPRVTRITMVVVVAYLLSPIDLVPDVIPVVGYLDDAIIVALAMRLVIATCPPEVVARRWPGSADGLAAVRRLAGRHGVRE
jgi:uncharacterized membrane protein YkvA (DUF1232 family)